MAYVIDLGWEGWDGCPKLDGWNKIRMGGHGWTNSGRGCWVGRRVDGCLSKRMGGHKGGWVAGQVDGDGYQGWLVLVFFSVSHVMPSSGLG